MAYKPQSRQRIFHVDDYGADPSGVASSDAAVIAAYADLAAAGRGIIQFGVGKYKLSAGLNNASGRCLGVEQSVIGQGSGQTIIDYRGAGACLEFRNQDFDATPLLAGGCFGLQIEGWYNNLSNTCGIRYGDIYHMRIEDVQISGFINSGGKGLWGDNQTRWSERAYIDVAVSKCTECIVFESNTGDVGFPTGSFDYSTYILSVIADVNQNGVAIRSGTTGSSVEFVGVDMTIYANCKNATSPATNSGVLFAVGKDDTDTAQFSGQLKIFAETSGGGTVGHKDINVGSTKYGAQALVNCVGAINLSGNNAFRPGTATHLRFGFTGSLRNSPSLGSTGTVSTFQPLQVMNQARGQTNLASGTYTLYLESGNIFELEPNAGSYGMRFNAGALTYNPNADPAPGSPFGTTVVDLWIRQPSNASQHVTVNDWFSEAQSFVWADGVVPTLGAAAGTWDLIRLTSFNFADWVGQHVTKPAASGGGTTDSTKEPIITAGTSSQWWRGDKTWQPIGAETVGKNYFPPGSYASGYYYAFNSAASSSTATLGNQNLRLSPAVITSAVTVSKLWVEHTSAGESGSTFRVGIYADDGTGWPGSLVVDGGTVSTAGAAAVQEVTVNVTLNPGLYWVGGVVQNAATTQPTMRTINGGQMESHNIPMGTTLPGANTLRCSVVKGSVTGALPSSFSALGTGVVSGSYPARVGFKVA